MPQISSPSMASMALKLKHNGNKTLLKPYTANLTFYNLYSSSSNNNNGGQNPKKPLDFTSFFPDIKSTLKNPNRNPSNEKIARNIAEFRQRSNPGPISNPNPGLKPKGNVFDGIRESLRHLQGSKGQNVNLTRDGGGGGNRFSLDKYKESFSPSANTSTGKVYGGSLDSLSSMAFRKELEKEKGKGRGRVEDEWESARLFRDYTFDDLGDRLRELRPEMAKGEGERGGGWFSFGELNERLKKLRVIEKNLSPKSITIVRDSMMKMKHEQDQAQKTAASKLFVLGGIHKMKESTPKEHLIERYFHPDNMSSEEKMKLKLKEVRDEFKMHESDCGSTRVQIAQLTTEIIHLSAVLHKKDKHSRRGLLAKVQQRKKLLKYLRRTDWDSYCFVLSKLGLRDNPDYKN